MKTTNKCFKEQVQNHILNGLLDAEELRAGYGIETTEENLLPNQLQIVSKEFKSWYGPYEQKLNPNRQAAFTSWMDGLPTCLHTEYEYYNVHNTMKSWFEACDEEYKTKEPNEKEYNLYKNLVYRELNTLSKKNGVNLF